MDHKESIIIKVTTDEKSRIKNHAAQDGCSVSEYMRRCALNEDTRHDGKLLQDIAHRLCRLAEATNQVDAPDVRRKLVQVEAEIWQLIK